MSKTIENLRLDFPSLNIQVYGKPLVYFDHAATTHRPQSVIDSQNEYYKEYNATVHRGVYNTSARATLAFESTRKKVARFLNASSEKEIIFTKGCTESINLVAQSWGRRFLNPGDEVLLTQMEHHAMIVPWQMICKEKGAVLKVVPITEEGTLDLEVVQSCLSPKTKFVGCMHASNVLGTFNPIKAIIGMAHQVGAVVLIDGAQAIPHCKVDVQNLDADFYVFSPHKMGAPTGIGVLYGKKDLLESMPPYQGGGHAIEKVSFDRTTFQEAPYKFEPGTPNVAGVIGLGKAIEYLYKLGWEFIDHQESVLNSYFLNHIHEVPNLKLFGPMKVRLPVFSFIMEPIHPHDIATLLDKEGIAVRAGHHCCMPLARFLGVSATTRASLNYTNTIEEIDHFIQSLKKIDRLFNS